MLWKTVICGIQDITKQVKPGFTIYQPQLNDFRALSEIEETTKNSEKQ